MTEHSDINTQEHYRIVTFCGPTAIAEAYYDNFEESLTEYLAWCKMYWKDDLQSMTIEEVIQVASQGEDQTLVVGYPQLNIRWFRFREEVTGPTFLLN